MRRGFSTTLGGAAASACLLAFLPVFLAAAPAGAVTSSRSVPSSMGGNGHNISFDGRLLIITDSTGWVARMLRPEGITYLPDGLPDALGPMWSASVTIQPPVNSENALAICEPDPSLAPYACDASGAAVTGGAYDCYDVWIFDSDAVQPGGGILRRRHLKVWVESPRTAAAEIYSWVWDSGLETLSPTLMGIEPTMTSDGKLMVWQGHPDNNGSIDILMYSVNTTACAVSGWSAPEVISHMVADPTVVGTYRLAERTLRAADGEVFLDGDLVHGAYPWIMPNGDAIIFTGAPMPCMSPDNPPGCGPRRNALSVIGYPTNWGVAVIDGGVNPANNDMVRLFFSSPGPTTFGELPVGAGLDVWPFFGSNTSNYVELFFDDGLDGNYAGFWHLNENVDSDGNLDFSRTPDVSGYFNTGELHGGLGFPAANDGVVGKALTFDGIDDRVEVADALSLTPVNGITIDFWIRPDVEPDCDANNNYRFLLGKGNIGTGSYSVVFEEGHALQVRVNVGGVQQSIWTPPLAMNVWTHVSCEYDGKTGAAGCWFDDVEVATLAAPPGTITGSTDILRFGGPGPRAACPDGDGSFAGALDEVSVSRYARRLGDPPTGGPGGSDAGVPGGSDAGNGPGPGTDAGSGPVGGDGGPAGAGDGGGGPGIGSGRGCACRIGAGDGSAAAPLLVLALVLGTVRGRRRRTR